MRWRALLAVLGAIGAGSACGEALNLEESPTGPDAATEGGQPPPGPDAAVDAQPNACAAATWVFRPTAVPYAVALDDGKRLYVGGHDAEKGWLAEIDPCDGRVIKEARFAPPDGRARANVRGLLALDTEIHVTGDVEDDHGGLHGRFDKNLNTLGLSAVPGNGISNLTRIARAPDGTIWLGGGSAIFSPDAQAGWLVRVGGPSCTVGRMLAGLVATGPGTVVALTMRDGAARLVQIDASCVQAELPMPLGLGQQGPPTDLTAVGATFYAVGGAGGANGGAAGYLAARTAQSDWTIAQPLDPNPLPEHLDRLIRVATDGVAVFTGGLQKEDLGGGTPSVYRYALPLSGKSTPVWNTVPFGADLLPVEDVKAAPAGDEALFVVGATRVDPRRGAIARCRKLTGCDAK